MGGGLFSNFWKPEQPYTLEAKCIEIYHWRDGVEIDADGVLQMNEAKVEARVRDTMADEMARKRILDAMLRIRDPAGIYENGGCLDASREYPRCVCPDSADIPLVQRMSMPPQVGCISEFAYAMVGD